MLTGYNSMLVGPDVTISGYKLSALDAVVKSVSSLTGVESPAEGDVVYLTTPEGANGVGLYTYNGTSWEPYKGEINA